MTRRLRLDPQHYPERDLRSPTSGRNTTTESRALLSQPRFGCGEVPGPPLPRFDTMTGGSLEWTLWRIRGCRFNQRGRCGV